MKVKVGDVFRFIKATAPIPLGQTGFVLRVDSDRVWIKMFDSRYDNIGPGMHKQPVSGSWWLYLANMAKYVELVEPEQ